MNSTIVIKFEYFVIYGIKSGCREVLDKVGRIIKSDKLSGVQSRGRTI